MIISFLILNKFSIETTKLKLDMYYTLRTLIPEIYENKNPRLPHMKKVADKNYVIPLPKITKEGYRVTILKPTDDNPDNFDPYDFFGHCYNIIEIRIQEDIPFGDVLVYDFQFFKKGHILKMTPISVKKSVIVLEKVFSNRVKAIHFINTPSYIDILLAILRPLLKPKLNKRLHVHQKSDAILKCISKDILPKDYGGDELSLFELNELWKNKLSEYQDRFDALDKMRTNEKLRPTPLVNDEILGFHGNFKKLNVD
ncbi:hypothetical protein NQ314_003171 [Rhamnusium bicolor]|uniref:CRAL-TRIO domain-containing protein n=1 Tax=Rhamnusium bicolor TaxID=1586634 RepID=A0AAV8ZNJ1_9CUCU|nr:hypothetical protein NQ314_003171 [Rhamnusium bicolor]